MTEATQIKQAETPTTQTGEAGAAKPEDHVKPEPLVIEPLPEQPKRVEAVRNERRRRKGMGLESAMKLTIPEDAKDPDYEYRWAEGSPQRITQLTKYDDYDVVTSEQIASDSRQNGLGVTPERHGGVDEQGNAYSMVLLRKRKDFYEEDQKEKQARVDEREKAIKRGSVEGDKGLSGPNAYTPDGGISIDHGRES